MLMGYKLLKKVRRMASELVLAEINFLNKLIIIYLLKRGGKFPKKLWCCVDGEYNKIFWFYQLGC